ncbi:MAG: hypothetical protein FWE11_07350 [Defluviitaleaceae bacterium]|nr:hypothetical protein [Defluviitaleaceae bacterium]
MRHSYIPGDVFIFRIVEGEILGELIGYFTGSDVSHAAMVYDEEHVVEMGPEGIKVTPICKSAKVPFYHLRHSTQTDMTKVVGAAKKYYNAHIPYDYPSLVILAGMIIYHKHRYTPKYKELVDLILTIACWSLDELLKKITKRNGAMMCSQLVYQCFRDAGCRSRLKLKSSGAVFENEKADNAIRLVDLVGKNKGMKRLETFKIPPSINEEEIIRNLYETHIGETELERGGYLTGQDLTDTASAVNRFMTLLNKVFKKIGPHIPRPSLFITPVDLINTKNLSYVRGPEQYKKGE